MKGQASGGESGFRCHSDFMHWRLFSRSAGVVLNSVGCLRCVGRMPGVTMVGLPEVQMAVLIACCQNVLLLASRQSSLRGEV